MQGVSLQVQVLVVLEAEVALHFVAQERCLFESGVNRLQRRP
jgi:hypothetical protein